MRSYQVLSKHRNYSVHLRKRTLRMHEDIYKQHILDHASRPRNKGALTNATYTAQGSNPSCGDVLTIFLTVNGDFITHAMFDGTGCAISQAAASMLTQKLTGLPMGSARALTEADVYAMLGIDISSARRKCALLAFRALQAALAQNL
jgi:nitrogen fixation protein NifU and related proteins